MKHFTKSLLSALFLIIPTLSCAALSDYFVTTDWLQQNRDDVVVLDVRQPAFFLLGHIDGAHSVPRSAFLEKRNHVKSLVPTAASLKKLLSSLGVTPDSTLVVYAEDDNPYAARLVWTLQYHGHKKSYVLDGGYDKWAAEERATALRPTPRPNPSDYRLTPETEYLDARAEADYVYTRLENPGVLVWDTRRTDEYIGTEVRAERGGHIPGAVHLNWVELLSEVNGVKVLKERDEIITLLQANGLTNDKEIVAHCQTGIRSSYTTLVLLGLGYERVKNYDGSWIEWANNPTLPIININGQVDSSVQVSLTLGETASSNVTKTVTQ